MQWAIDPTHSQIQFAVKHMGLSTVRGAFEKFSGTITEENGTVTGATVEIDMTSINTGVGQRDDHLRGPDFFDASTHPTASFVLDRFVRDGDSAEAHGTLTIRGVSRPVVLKGEVGGPAKDPWGNQKVSASLEAKISRKEWGLVWNAVLESGGVLVSDDVRLTIEVQAAPVTADAAA